MKVVGLSDRGLRREKNEDSFLIKESQGIFAVCDGMGGHRAGDVASKMAIKAIEQFIDQNPEQDPLTLIKNAVDKANQIIWKNGQQNSQWFEMGTTATVAMIKDQEINIAHVGDSGLYLVRDGKINKITKDHTLAQQMVEEGLIKAEEIRKSSYNHILTRALGVEEDVLIDSYKLELCPGDYILMCSDGLNDMITEQEILSIVAANIENEDNIATGLLQKALDNGGFDNITLILLCI